MSTKQLESIDIFVIINNFGVFAIVNPPQNAVPLFTLSELPVRTGLI